MPWWPTKDMAQDSEARCRIDLGLTPIWRLLLELQMAGINLVNSLRPSCLVGFYLEYGEFFG